MGDTFSKRVELAIRRGVIQLVSYCLSRQRKAPPSEAFLRDSKILFLRQNQIGDALLSTPIFYALHHAYPTLQLHVLVDKRNAVVFNQDPFIQKVWHLKKGLRDVLRLISALRGEHYDAVVDLIHSPSTTSTLLLLALNPTYAIGFERENDFIYHITVPTLKGQRMRRQLAEVLRVFHLPPDATLHSYLPLDDDANAFGNRVIDEVKRFYLLDSPKGVIGVNLSASRNEKYWSEEAIKGFCEGIRKAHPNYAIVLIASPKDYEHIRHLAEALSIAMCPMMPRFQDFAAVISTLDVLVSLDSAAVHIADMFFIPIVLLTPSPPSLTEWYPSQSHFIALHSETGDCRSISAHHAIKAVSEVLSKMEHP